MSKESSKNKPKTPKPVRQKYLENAAYFYLNRYTSSSENLRRVLKRKAMKRVYLGAELPDELDQWIDDVVKKCIHLGYVDDQSYAKMRAKSGLNKGWSLRRIQMDLSQKGIDGDTVKAILSDLNKDDMANERAALRLAERRRFGPFGLKDVKTDEKQKQRQMSAMARAGFSFELIKAIILSEDKETLYAELLEE